MRAPALTERHYLLISGGKAPRANQLQIAAGQGESPETLEISGLFVMRDQFRYTLKIGKIESWSGFKLFQPYFLLTISRDREESRDF